MKEKNYMTSKAERYSYGVYFLGQLIFCGIATQFLSLYMTTSVGISAVTASGIFAITRVWDAVNDPMFGIIVDKAHLKKGKYIPWIRISTILIPITTVLMFMVPSSVDYSVKVAWMFVAYILWSTSYTICDVPIFALATSMTNNLKERDWLYMFNRFFCFAGGMVVIIFMPILYEKLGWSTAVIIMSVIGFVSMYPIGRLAKERFQPETGENTKFLDIAKYLIHNKPLLIINGATIVASITNTGSAVSNYVAIYCLNGSEWITYLGLVMTLPMVISIFLTQAILKKVDKYYVYIVCQVANLILGVIMYLAGYDNKVVFMFIVAVRAMFSSALGVIQVMFTADCAEYGHFMTGKRAQGIAFSIQTFTAKITGALAGSIGLLMLGLVGFKESSGGEYLAQSEYTINWIWKMFTVLPLISGTVAVLIIIFFYRLKRSDVEIMMKANYGEITREEALEQLRM